MRRQLAVAVRSVAVFVILGEELAFFFSLHFTLKSVFDESLRTKANALVTASEIEGGEIEIDMDVQEFAGFGSNRPGDYYEIFARDRAVLQRSPSLGATDLPDIPAASTQEEGVTNLTLPEEKEGRAFWTNFTPVSEADDRYTDLRIVAASNLISLDRTIRIVGTVMAVFAAIGIAVALVSPRAVVGKELESSRSARRQRSEDRCRTFDGTSPHAGHSGRAGTPHRQDQRTAGETVRIVRPGETVFFLRGSRTTDSLGRTEIDASVGRILA